MNVNDLDLFVVVQLYKDTPPAPSLGQLCEDHGYSYEWTGGQTPRLIENGRRILCSKKNCVPAAFAGLSSGSSSSSAAPSSTKSSSQVKARGIHMKIKTGPNVCSSRFGADS